MLHDGIGLTVCQYSTSFVKGFVRNCIFLRTSPAKAGIQKPCRMSSLKIKKHIKTVVLKNHNQDKILTQ